MNVIFSVITLTLFLLNYLDPKLSVMFVIKQAFFGRLDFVGHQAEMFFHLGKKLIGFLHYWSKFTETCVMPVVRGPLTNFPQRTVSRPLWLPLCGFY